MQFALGSALFPVISDSFDSIHAGDFINDLYEINVGLFLTLEIQTHLLCKY